MQSSDHVYKPVGRRLLIEAAKTIEELQVCVVVTSVCARVCVCVY